MRRTSFRSDISKTPKGIAEGRVRYYKGEQRDGNGTGREQEGVTFPKLSDLELFPYSDPTEFAHLVV